MRYLLIGAALLFVFGSPPTVFAQDAPPAPSRGNEPVISVVDQLRALGSARPLIYAIPRTGAPEPGTVVLPAAPSLTLDGDVLLGGSVFKEGFGFLHADGGLAFGNTALGIKALTAATPGVGDPTHGKNNTAVGALALEFTTVGRNNTAVGYGSLLMNESGGFNTAVGGAALAASVGSQNTGLGSFALRYATGEFNTAGGSAAGLENTVGERNVAFGASALRNNTLGSDNIAIGTSAGTNLGDIFPMNGSSYSNNIFIGNEGEVPDENTIRIGTGGTHTDTYIAGLDTDLTGTATHSIVIDSVTGQVGRGAALMSSERYKREIDGMGDSSSPVMRLRPVTFRFREEVLTGDAEVQFGLIAEEVAAVFPELVEYDDTGRPHTVKYRQLSSLLLNEMQKQQAVLSGQARELGLLKARLERLEQASGGIE